VATDVCRVLDMADVTSALRVLDQDEKGPLTVRTPGGDHAVNCISEKPGAEIHPSSPAHSKKSEPR
jgi:prophage antirepressor-like protein